jgi:hypothetical protein
MCSSESVECICLKEIRNKHTGSSFEKFYQEEIVAQDHIEPEVVVPKQESDDESK